MSFGFGLAMPSGGALSPASVISGLFADGTQGAWYDPSDLTTLFQDSAGTTPVTAVEQPVGLMLDKSKGLVLGAELVTNGDFGSGTTGWVSGATLTSTAAVVSGEMQVTATVDFGRQVQTLTLVPGRGYLITGSLRRVSGPTNTAYVALGYGAQTDSAIAAQTTDTTASTFRYIFFPTNATVYVQLSCRTSVVGGFDNISVRELPGNHAFQSTSASRPTYSRRINLLTYTEQFDNAAWSKLEMTVTANAATAPNGTTTADLIIPTTVSSAHTVNQAVLVVGQTYTAQVLAKAGGYRYFAISNAGSPAYSSVFDLQTGAIVNGASITSSSSENLGNGWYRCSITFVAAFQTFSYYVSTSSTNISVFAGDGTSGIYVWGASLVPSNLATLPYQRVVTSTDYNADPTLFPAYLRADGTDDGMLTNSIDFTGTDKMFVSAGVRKLSDAARAVVVELGNAASAAIFRLEAPNSAAGNNYNFATGGTTLVAIAAATFTSPISNVVSGIGNISGDSAILRVNGTEATSSAADQGTGNFGNYPLYLFRRGGSSLPFNGWFYGSVIAGKTLTASQISAVERYLASKTMTVTVP